MTDTERADIARRLALLGVYLAELPPRLDELTANEKQAWRTVITSMGW